MRVEEMRDRVRLMRPVTTTDQFGSKVTTYQADANPVHAQLVRQTGRRSEEVSEHFADYQAEFYVLRAHAVADNWQLQHIGGYLYTVTNIIPCRDPLLKKLQCVRVNE